MYWLLTFVLLPQNMAAEGCAFGGRCECSSSPEAGNLEVVCHKCPRPTGTHDPFRLRPCLPPQTPAWPVARLDARGLSPRAPGEPSTCPDSWGLIPRGQSPSPLSPTALSPHPFLLFSFTTSLCLRGTNSDDVGL